MINSKTILAPVDFSEHSLSAAKQAVVMADPFDADLVLMHVIPPYWQGTDEPDPWPTEVEMERKLSQFTCALVGTAAQRKRIERVVLQGDPAKRIAEFARVRAADLVMMPTHGYGPFRRFLLGSVTAKLLHDLACPVFTGTHLPDVPVSDFKPYARVACAIDLRDHSEDVLRWAQEFAQSWDAELVVIHAAPSLEREPAEGQYFTAELRQMLIRAKTEDVNALLGKVGCQVRTALTN